MDHDLKAYIDRAARLLSDASAIAYDLKELLKDAKDAGYTPAEIRKVAAIRVKGSAAEEAQRIARLIEYGRAGGVQLELGFTTSNEVKAAAKAFVEAVPEGTKTTIHISGHDPVTIDKRAAG